jgi:hypothetical protein
MKRCAVLFAFVLTAGMLAAAPASAEPTTMCNVPIAMSDGVVLRANITRPDDGVHPTVLTVTGYNKDVGRPTGNCAAGSATLVGAGYNVMVLDDRGTGSSGGRWDVWSERTQRDYREVLDWLVAQPWQDGVVGTTGGSYLGITSLLVAEADAERVRDLGKAPAVKAVWADVPMADAYRDVTFFGGNLDTDFMPVWFGFTQGVNTNTPVQLFQGDPPVDVATTTVDHFAGGPAVFGANLVSSSLTGDRSSAFMPYDQPQSRLRSPAERAGEITAAVFYTGGWYDIFQRGEPYLWNALSSTPPGGKKWVQSPTYHTAGNNHWDETGIGTRNQVFVKWFDHWLKGAENGVEDVAPIHHWKIGDEAWETRSAWPDPATDWTSMYLASGAALAAEPASATKQDLLPFVPAGGICNRSTVQWAAGAGGGNGLPCENDERAAELTTLNYTTAPLDHDLHIAGPLNLHLWAELDRFDTSFYAALTDVSPSGVSVQISSGALNASFRELDESRTWRNADGDVILAYHPFTVESQHDIIPYQPLTYDIEIYPTDWVLKAGHSLRVVLGTADTPHYQVPQDRLQKMLGGINRILVGGAYASKLTLPVQPR